TAVAQQPLGARMPASGHRPAQRLERVIFGERQVRETADVERAGAVIVDARQRSVFHEDLVRVLVGKSRPMTEALCNLPDDPPVGARLTAKPIAITGI